MSSTRKKTKFGRPGEPPDSPAVAGCWPLDTPARQQPSTRAIKGFAWQVASLASIVASYFIAFYFRNNLASVINAQAPWNLFLAMLLLYGGSSFFIWMIFRLVSTAIDKVRLKEFDRHMGALFGFAKGTAYCLLVTMFAMTLLGNDKQRAICSSRSGYYMSKVLASADGLLPKEVDDVIGPHLDQLGKKLEDGRSGQLVNTPTTDSNGWNLGFSNPLNGNGQANGNGQLNPFGQANNSGQLNPFGQGNPFGQSNPAGQGNSSDNSGGIGLKDLGGLAGGLLNSITGNNGGSNGPSGTLPTGNQNSQGFGIPNLNLPNPEQAWGGSSGQGILPSTSPSPQPNSLFPAQTTTPNNGFRVRTR